MMSLLKWFAVVAALLPLSTPPAGESESAERPRVEVRSFIKDGRAWKRGTPACRVTFEKHSIDPGQSMAGLLHAQGIIPDSEAMTLLYELNPNLEEADPGGKRTIIIPQLLTEPLAQKALKAGYHASLVTDADLKQRLSARLENILGLQAKGAKSRLSLPEDPVGGILYWQAVASIAEALEKIVARVQNRTVPVEVLLQITAIAELIEESMERLALPGSVLDEEDLRVATAVDEDLQVRLDSLTPVRGSSQRIPKVNVRVRVRSIGNKSPLSHMEIHYTPVALLNKRHWTFNPSNDESGAVATQAMLEADYFLWAANALSGERQSDLKRVNVRRAISPDDQIYVLHVP
jgi:hypothetical protein